MSGATSIEWADATWNPVRGCVKISPGCKHCYAETFAERWRGVAGHAYEQGFDPRLVPSALDWPLRRRKPQRIFVNSMSDLFQDAVPINYIAACLGMMALACHHTYQVLTKRGDRMAVVMQSLCLEACTSALLDYPIAGPTRAQSAAIARALPPGSPFASGATASLWPLPNVWLGVSAEDRRYGLPRIDHLRKVPAAVRFVSFEPLLEDLGPLNLSGIQWVIIGAESGHGRREMRERWVRNIVTQAKEQGCKVFFKQAFENGKKVSLPLLDGRKWDELPA